MHQAVLAEYLASCGYVVVTTPSPTRIGTPMHDESDIYPVARLQAHDLHVAVRAVARRGWADSTRVAVVGHSFGARAGLLLLADGDSRLLVSLDGGIADSIGRNWLTGTNVDTAKIPGSVVHLYQVGDSTIVPDFTLLHALTGTDRVLVRVSGVSHWHFTSFGVITDSFPTVAPGKSTPAGAEAAARIDDYARCALDAWNRGAVRAADACAAAPPLRETERLARGVSEPSPAGPGGQ